jgi:TatD DNase family protein
VIVNAAEDFEMLNAQVNYSAGLHPWFLKENSAEIEFESLKRVCKQDHVLAIGECGLDKVCETPLALQEEYFAKQIDLANEIRKPIIIHCVRAYDEVLSLLKDKMNSVPVVFHGYNRNMNIARNILDHGHYLSFGKHLLKSDDVRAVFQSVPVEKIFLETDDSAERIEDIYTVAATLHGITGKDLEDRVATNVINVFGKLF